MDFEVESVLPENALNELQPMPGQLAPLGSRWISPWAAVAILFAGLLAAAPFLYRAWNRRETARRRKSAYQIAAGQLQSLLRECRRSTDAAKAVRMIYGKAVAELLKDAAK